MFTKLNRVLLASGLAIASAAMLSPAAFAQLSSVGTITAQVNAFHTIAWTYTAGTLILLPNGLTAETIGTVTTTTNDPLGTKIVASSANGGVLSNGVVANNIAYTLDFDTSTAVAPTKLSSL